MSPVLKKPYGDPWLGRLENSAVRARSEPETAYQPSVTVPDEAALFTPATLWTSAVLNGISRSSCAKGWLVVPAQLAAWQVAPCSLPSAALRSFQNSLPAMAPMSTLF